MVRRKLDPPRGVLKTPVVEGQRLRHDRYHPSSDLEGYVEHYWVVEWDLRGRPPHRAETLPHPNVHMVLEADGQSSIRGAARAKFSRLLEDRGGVTAVKFAPGGFHAFVDVPVSTFTDRVVALHDVFGVDGTSLERAVAAEATDLARLALVEEFLRARRPRADQNIRLASSIVSATASDREIVKVEQLVDRYGLHKRSLQRLFATYVGVSPKWVIQRYRLHEAAEQLAAGTAFNHAALAQRLGYSDQAHFVRDFKTIVGVSPAAYAEAALRATASSEASNASSR